MQNNIINKDIIMHIIYITIIIHSKCVATIMICISSKNNVIQEQCTPYVIV